MSLQFDDFEQHYLDLYLGEPKSGKTTVAGSYPKPLWYISINSDGGGIVLKNIEGIKVKNIQHSLDTAISRKVIDFLLAVEQEVAKDPKCVKTVVVDTVSGIEESLRSFIENKKNGKNLSFDDWSSIGSQLAIIRDIMIRISTKYKTRFVWIMHTKTDETVDNTDDSKVLKIIPNMTKNNGLAFTKFADNIFYTARKTVLEDGRKSVAYLTYIGSHPAIPTNSRELLHLSKGFYIKDFDYKKWEELKSGKKPEQVNLSAEQDNEAQETKKHETETE